jgi:hypothetical protein
MSQITFTYYPKNSKASPNGDGDIKAKVETLALLANTEFTGLSIASICRIALLEWLETANPAGPIPTPGLPLANKKSSVSFTLSDRNVDEMLEELRAANDSKYKHWRDSRIYVVGINAWLDAKLAHHKIKWVAKTNTWEIPEG